MIRKGGGIGGQTCRGAVERSAGAYIRYMTVASCLNDASCSKGVSRSAAPADCAALGGRSISESDSSTKVKLT